MMSTVGGDSGLGGGFEGGHGEMALEGSCRQRAGACFGAGVKGGSRVGVMVMACAMGLAWGSRRGRNVCSVLR